MKALFNMLLSIGIRRKLIAGYIFMSVMILGILGFIAVQLVNVKWRYDSMSALESEVEAVVQLKSTINGIRSALLWGLLSNDIGAVVGSMESNIDKCNNIMSKLKQGRYAGKVEEMTKFWGPFVATIRNELVPLASSGKSAEAVGVIRSVQSTRAQEFMRIADAIIKKSQEDRSSAMEDLNGHIKSASLQVIIFMVVFFSLGFVISYRFISIYMIGDLLRIGHAVDGLADGDLSIRIEPKSRDEFGIVAEKMNATARTFNNMIGNVLAASGKVISAVDVLKSMTGKASEGTKIQFQQAALISDSADKMIKTIVTIADNSSTATKSSLEGMATTDRGRQVIDTAVETVMGVNQETTELSKLVESLNARVAEIGDILTVIKEIADQTNLLALNAAIEAARAGDQGRGFAVVADEVRKLAEKTIKATVDISGKISTIQHESEQTQTSMTKASGKVTEATQYIREAGAALQSIESAIRHTHSEVNTIANAVSEHTGSSLDVSVNIEKTLSVSREMEQMAEELMREIHAMTSISEELRAAGSRFRTDTA